MKPGAFKDRSIDETINHFITQFADNANSSAAKEFLDGFARHIQSPAVPENEKNSARLKLEVLRIYSAEFIKSFRSTETGKEGLSPPSGFALTPSGNLVVSDDFNHRIQIYDTNHQLAVQFGSKGKNPGELHYPKGVATDREGNIYVADSWNHRVQKFDPKGRHLSVFGGYGSGLGQMNEPYDVCIDPMGNLIVVERYNHRIQIFSPDGTSLGWLGNRGTLLEEKLADLFETPESLLSSPVFEFPTSIDCDSQHNFYIADSGNHRILKFNPEWKQVQVIGGQGSGPGQFQYPLCVSVGPNDLLYVADLNNDRIQAFTSQGQFLFAFRETDSATPIKMPCLTLVDTQNRLYLGLTFNTKIPVFQVPAISQDALYEQRIQLQGDNFHNFFYQGKLFQASGATDMAANSYAKGLRLFLEKKENPDPADMTIPLLLSQLRHRSPEDNALLLKFLGLFDDLLQAMHGKVRSTHNEWEAAAVDFCKKLTEKENALLGHKEDPRHFDKVFYQAEKMDKTLFRDLRLLFYDYKKLTDLYAKFSCSLAQNLPSESDRAQLGRNLHKRLERICDLINSGLDAKEQNEEAMIRNFAEAPNDQKKWEDFRSKSFTNTRIMTVVRHYHYELRILLRTLKHAASACPADPWVEELLEKTVISGSHPLLKILLRDHECFHELNILLTDLIDTWITLRGATGPHSAITLEAGDIAPLAYDVENIRTEDMLATLLMEGMPVRRTEEGVACGGKTHRVAGNNHTGLTAQFEAIYKCREVYEQKHTEISNQITALQQQRLDLDTQLKQVDLRDKKAPIPIHKNIMIVDFQSNLLARMLITLEINETNNIARLLLCGALLAASGVKMDKAPAQTVLSTVGGYLADLEKIIGDLLVTRKKTFFEASAIKLSLEKINKQPGSESISQVPGMRNRLTHVELEYARLEAGFSHRIRIKNILGKLLAFANEIEASSPARKKDTLNLKYTFGLGGPVAGGFLAPAGIAYTKEGDLLVVGHYNHRVYRFTAHGTYVSEFGGWGNLFNLFDNPYTVATDSKGSIYVTDAAFNQRLQKFTKDGEFVLTFGDRGKPEERIGVCFSISIDKEDTIWATDMQNHRIQIYNADGKHIRSIGHEGKNPDNLFEPISICCLENGDYLVGDRSEYLLKRFNSQGKLLHTLKKEGLACDAFYFITSHPIYGIFVTDTWMNKILRLDSELRIVSVHDQAGLRGEQLGKTTGLSIKDNTLAVANLDTHKIHVFELLEDR